VIISDRPPPNEGGFERGCTMTRSIAQGRTARRFGFGMLAIAGLLGTAAGTPAGAQPSPAANFFTEYAVKFVCGPSKTIEGQAAFIDGLYATAVNVHNPGRAVPIERKVAIATIREGGPITGFVRLPLRYDQAIEFTCADIFAQAHVSPGAFATGFLVLHVPPREALDVVAVYTMTNGAGPAMHMERVPARAVSTSGIVGSPGGSP
jgi:hypothetical protein